MSNTVRKLIKLCKISKQTKEKRVKGLRLDLCKQLKWILRVKLIVRILIIAGQRLHSIGVWPLTDAYFRACSPFQTKVWWAKKLILSNLVYFMAFIWDTAKRIIKIEKLTHYWCIRSKTLCSRIFASCSTTLALLPQFQLVLVAPSPFLTPGAKHQNDKAYSLPKSGKINGDV